MTLIFFVIFVGVGKCTVRINMRPAGFRSQLRPEQDLMQIKLLVNLSEFSFKPLYLQKTASVNEYKLKKNAKLNSSMGEDGNRHNTCFSSISVSRFCCPNECRRFAISKTLSISSSNADSKSSLRSAGNLSTTGIRRKQLNCKQ